MEPDWYAILAIPCDADEAAIKAAHRRRARELHPDINASADATIRMAEVNRARDILLDPHARARFDRANGRAVPRTPTRATRQPSRQASNGRATTAGPIRFTFDHGKTDATIPDDVFEEAGRPERRADWRFDATAPGAADWYGFLGLPPWCTSNEIQAAIARLAPEATRANLEPNERAARAAKLRAAWEVLGRAASRQQYDAHRPAWRPRRGMPDLYRVIGVRPVASTETIGAAVARHARALGPHPLGAARERESAIREAWWVLRDPDRRAAYDASRSG